MSYGISLVLKASCHMMLCWLIPSPVKTTKWSLLAFLPLKTLRAWQVETEGIDGVNFDKITFNKHVLNTCQGHAGTARSKLTCTKTWQNEAYLCGITWIVDLVIFLQTFDVHIDKFKKTKNVTAMWWPPMVAVTWQMTTNGYKWPSDKANTMLYTTRR